MSLHTDSCQAPAPIRAAHCSNSRAAVKHKIFKPFFFLLQISFPPLQLSYLPTHPKLFSYNEQTGEKKILVALIKITLPNDLQKQNMHKCTLQRCPACFLNTQPKFWQDAHESFIGIKRHHSYDYT